MMLRDAKGRLMRTFLMGLLAVLAANFACAEDNWPQFRGPKGNGHAEAKNLPLALQAILHEMPAPLSAAEAPDPLARVLLKALEKSPDARYQTCAEVLADLVRVKATVVHS